jgi:hypothetical protein
MNQISVGLTGSRLLLLLGLLVGAISLLATPEHASAAGCSSSLQWKPNVPPRCEQIRYARETQRMTYTDFLARKQDYVINGCETPNNPGCTKPAPYNAFDWTTDGCSWTPDTWKTIFDGPCQQHDFGYRNFGKGLALGRSEAVRYYIDGRFLKEMRRVCSTWAIGPQRLVCVKTAKAMYSAVRVAAVGRLWGWGT